MAAALTNNELAIIKKLHCAGMQYPEATLAVAIVSREHARPLVELVDIARQYQGLEDKEVTKEAVNYLMRLGWLEESESYGLKLIRQSGDLSEKLSEYLQDHTVKAKLQELRASNDLSVAIIGSMTDSRTYDTYIDRIRQASSYIHVPMLATTPELSAARVIVERAKAGVQVKILLGTPGLVANLRGNTMRQVSIDCIKGWRKIAKESKNIQLRLTSSASAMDLASCAVIDGKILRFDVYDSRVERSLQGVLLEIVGREGRVPNMIRIFEALFNDAWDKASGVRFLSRILKITSKNWQWLVFVIFTLLTALFIKNVLVFSILSSIAASFFVNAFIENRNSIYEGIKQLWKAS